VSESLGRRHEFQVRPARTIRFPQANLWRGKGEDVPPHVTNAAVYSHRMLQPRGPHGQPQQQLHRDLKETAEEDLRDFLWSRWWAGGARRQRRPGVRTLSTRRTALPRSWLRAPSSWPWVWRAAGRSGPGLTAGDGQRNSALASFRFEGAGRCRDSSVPRGGNWNVVGGRGGLLYRGRRWTV
jgi:hypothetical protein